MARLTYDIPPDLESQFQRAGNIREIAKKMIEASIPIVVKATQEAVKTHKKTGAMIESVGLTEEGIQSTSDGAEGKVGFIGYDNNGVANDLKANVIEYGRSGKKGQPFLAKVRRQAQKDVENAQQAVLDKEIGGGT